MLTTLLGLCAENIPTGWLSHVPMFHENWIISQNAIPYNISGYMVLQTVHEHTIQILQTICVAFDEKWFSDRVTILHMSRQLSCRVMCKIVTWLDD